VKPKIVEPQLGDLQVWWIPQVPMKPFIVPVGSLDQAMKIMDVLAEYDMFQFKNKVKPDYANAGGLSVFEDGEWLDWENADGEGIDDLMRARP
jgi:hypothetical protein